MTSSRISDAKCIHVNSPDASWAIFCYTPEGDLFVNSDWGFFGFAWRSFGDDFAAFLKGADASYIISKFNINYASTSGRYKKIPKLVQEKLCALVEEFKNGI